MSNDSAPECLSHKDNRNLQTRLDYMLLYRSESKAKIIRVLETWTNTKYAECFKGTADSKDQKSDPPVEDLWITMSYDQFSLFVYGTIRHDTIKQQVDELVALKHIQRRVHPVYPYGPPQYLLNRGLVQKALDELEIPANLFDLSPVLLSPGKKRTPQERYPQGGGKKPTRDPGKIPPGTGETSHPSNNLSKNTKKHTENEREDSAGESEDAAAPDASASTHTQSSSQEYRPDLSYATDEKSWEAYEQIKPLTRNVSQMLANESDNHSHIATPTTNTRGEQDGSSNAIQPDGNSRGPHNVPSSNVPATARDTRQDATRHDGAGTNRLSEGKDGHADSLAGRNQQACPTTAIGDAHDRTTDPSRSGHSDGAAVPDCLPGSGVSGASQSAAANGGYEKEAQANGQAQLSTLSTGSPQASAKVEPPTNTAQNTKPATIGKTQLTLLGGQVREWYEIIRATRLRMTANNVNALNALGEEDGMTFENLKDVLDLHDSDQWVKDHNIPIGPQELADEKSKWRFERWKPVVVRNRQKAAPAPKSVSSLPSYHTMSDEEYYASLRGGNKNARTAYAR